MASQQPINRRDVTLEKHPAAVWRFEREKPELFCLHALMHNNWFASYLLHTKAQSACGWKRNSLLTNPGVRSVQRTHRTLCCTFAPFALLNDCSQRTFAERKQTTNWRVCHSMHSEQRWRRPHGLFSSAWLCQQSSWNRNSSVVRPSVVRVAIISEPNTRISFEFWLLLLLSHTLALFFLNFSKKNNKKTKNKNIFSFFTIVFRFR